MIKVKEKYIGGVKYKGIQYHFEGYSQEKLEELLKTDLGQFLEVDGEISVETPVETPVETIEVNQIDEVLLQSGIISPNMKKKLAADVKKKQKEKGIEPETPKYDK